MGETVALDTPVFVYYLEGHGQHGAACKRIFRQVEKGSLDAVTSTICAMEVLVRPHALDDLDSVTRYRTLFGHFPHLTVRPLDMDVADTAARLRAKHALGAGDAVVGATALVSGCRRLITNDRDLRVLEDEGLRVEILGMGSRSG